MSTSVFVFLSRRSFTTQIHMLVGRTAVRLIITRQSAMRDTILSNVANAPITRTRSSDSSERLIHTSSIFDSKPNVQTVKYSTSEMPEHLSDSDKAKRAAAFESGRDHIRSGQKIGVGSGSTAKYLVEYIEQEYKAGRLNDVQCVPTSFLTRQWLLNAKIPVSTPEETPNLDVAIDGADEMDAKFTCIKGGGGCLTQEKIIQSCAAKYIIIAQKSKRTSYLGQSFKYVPVEVVPIAYVPVKQWIEKTHGGHCELRMAKDKCGAVITDNNNYILDWHFPDASVETDWHKINTSIACRAGVVETGLFLDVVDFAYLGSAEGEVQKLQAH
ncbi:Ribose-5-phosphate isomerase [Aphelenchoides besseyi]|nr:Ribose-5-phosphate isomerase [Aphelenchoides besseyi]